MPVLTAVYCRSHTIGGLLIRHRDPFGKWSHCGILTGENSVIESRAFHGVGETHIADFLGRYDDNPAMRQFVSIECENPHNGIAWARSQIGKGYDYAAIFGLALRKSWHNEDRWHCAELLEMTLVMSGRQRFRDSAYRISPNMSYITV